MKQAKIGDIIKISKGKKADLIIEERIDDCQRFIQIDDLRNNKNIKYTNSKGVKVSPDDIIIAWDGANAGTVGYGLSGIIGSTLAKLEILTKEIFPNYLGYFLKSKFKYLRDQCTGATIPHISKQILSDLQIPIPTLEDQKRIVKILDQANILIQKRNLAIRLLNEYQNSFFIELFGNQNTNPKNWPVKKLGEIADICSGVTKGRKFGDSKTVFVPYMRVANVQDGHINLSEIKEIEVLPGDIEKYRLMIGDLLLTEGGDPDKLGRGGIWKGEVKVCIHQNHIFRVRLNNKITVPEYISAQIGSIRGKNYFLKSAKQTTGIATINMTQLKNYPTLVPPVDLQKRYTEVVKLVDKLREKMVSQATELDIHIQALTQKAFKGELTN